MLPDNLGCRFDIPLALTPSKRAVLPHPGRAALKGQEREAGA
ncbi:MAG TPA: hypothetical protein VFT36_08450 [Methylomirabilota bacterium]|nr:hypothetical protein [Methylomirabilota bacterium]